MNYCCGKSLQLAMTGWLVLLSQVDDSKGDISDSVCDSISGKLHVMLV